MLSPVQRCKAVLLILWERTLKRTKQWISYTIKENHSTMKETTAKEAAEKYITDNRPFQGMTEYWQ